MVEGYRMYKIPLAEIKQKIVDSKKLSSEELDLRIKSKINELAGLISEEGSATIIANELGIELFSQKVSKLKIKELYAGMRNVGTLGKVMRVFEVREFAKGEKKGKVGSITIGDETGTIRTVFWNDQTDLLKKIQEGDIISIGDSYVRENNGGKELHLGTNGEVKINPDGETIKSVRQGNSFERKNIQQLQDGEEGAEILGTIVQVFDPRFFNVCGTCAKKVTESQGSFHCNEHGQVPPSVSYVLNVVLDDGTGTIRVVFWKNQATHLLGKEEKDIAAYKDNISTFEDVKTDLLGEQFKVMGRVKRNEMFDRLEFNVQLVQKANAQEELARLEKQAA